MQGKWVPFDIPTFFYPFLLFLWTSISAHNTSTTFLALLYFMFYYQSPSCFSINIIVFSLSLSLALCDIHTPTHWPTLRCTKMADGQVTFRAYHPQAIYIYIYLHPCHHRRRKAQCVEPFQNRATCRLPTSTLSALGGTPLGEIKPKPKSKPNPKPQKKHPNSKNGAGRQAN